MVASTIVPIMSRIVGRRTFVAASRSSRPTAAQVALDDLPPSHALGSTSKIAKSTLDCTSTFATRYFTALTIQPEIKLYQYHICPFCNITKSLLSYSHLDFKTVEVNPLTKAELKSWSGGYTKVPIALIDKEQVNGSEEIIDSILSSPHVQHTLEARWLKECTTDDENRMTMQQFLKSENAIKWLRFARDDLATLLYPNICGTLSDSFDAFRYVKNVDSFTNLQKIYIQWFGAVAMHFAASKIKSKRNITDERVCLIEALDNFEKEGLQDGMIPYLSGVQCPNMGDVAVFGVLNSVEGLNAHNDVIHSRGGHVKEWYDRMYQQVLGKGIEQ